MAEDWTTTDGKTYKDVLVCRTLADSVTIQHDGKDDVVSVPLATLSPELQKRFGYNPHAALFAANAVNASKMAAETPKPEVVTVPPVPTTSASAPKRDVSAIQNRIAQLEQDIAEKTSVVEREPGNLSHGAYRNIIAQDRAELTTLTAQLAAK